MTRVGGPVNAISPRCAAAITGPNRRRAGASISQSRASWFGRSPTAGATGSTPPPIRAIAPDGDARAMVRDRGGLGGTTGDTARAMARDMDGPGGMVRGGTAHGIARGRGWLEPATELPGPPARRPT